MPPQLLTQSRRCSPSLRPSLTPQALLHLLTKTNDAASAPCHVGVTHQQSSISRATNKPVEANPRFSGQGGAIRGVAVRERGGVGY
ncbi:hypothetical protein FCV25MIE_06084 [Fagus crenata]